MSFLRTILLLSFCFAAISFADEAQTNSLGMQLRLLEGGRYLRGTDGGERAIERAFPLSANTQFFGNPEYPKHITWITKPFWIATTEVTVGQWKQFVEATGYVTTAEKGDPAMVGWSPTPEEKPLYQSHDFERKLEFSWKNPGFPQTDEHPVVGVSWLDAKAFIEWLSKKEGARYRLPTEAEWEFACRAGTETWFSFGDHPLGLVHQHANVGNVELEKHRKHSVERQWLIDFTIEPEDGNVFTAPVGSYEANAFGLHDMHGNVWEWCQDLWLDTFYKRFDWPDRGEPRLVAVDPVNESEPQTDTNRFRTIRGGSWYNGPVICRSANRVGWDEPDAASYIGFRVVKEAGGNTSDEAKGALEKEEAARKAITDAGGVFRSTQGLDLELRIEGEAFPSQILGEMASLPELERLILIPKQSTVLSSGSLGHIVAAKSLRSVNFSGSWDLSAADLGRLAELPQLEELEFSRSTSLTDKDLEKLKSLITLKGFRCYGAGGGITDAGVSFLASNRGLERLELFEVDADGSCLPKFISCPLTVLSVTARGETGGTLTNAHAGTIAKFPGLTKLELNQQGLVRDLTLLGNAPNPVLRELNLHGCSGIPAEGFAAIGGLGNLRTLNLQGTSAGDEAVSAFSSFPRLENLRIGSPNLTDAGFALLAKLFSLESLYIETSSATDEGVKHLGRINRLQRLDIGVPAMTGTGLGPVSRLPELNDLRLRSPALTNVVFEQFARSKSLRKLRLVERGWQPPPALTNEGMMAIAPATWLTELWLPRNDTGITEAGMEDLKKLMPKTGVIPYSVEWDRPENSAVSEGGEK